mgnify:CR=1 FL=1|jgi:hypothetical protein
MEFVLLPDEVIRLIWEYLITNTDSISLLKSCRHFYIFGKKYGYIRELSVKNFSGFDFMEKSVLHANTITSLVLDSVDWAPKIWPEKVTFINCENNRKIVPKNALSTKVLCINLRHNNVNIEWEKFPSLEKIYIRVYDINLEDIEKCTKLSTINLDIGLFDKAIPDFILHFKGDLTLNLTRFKYYYPPDNKRFQRW